METAALYFAASNMCWVEKERMLAKIQMYLTKSEDGTYDFSAVSAPFEGFLLRESPMELGENDVIDGLRMEKKDWLKCFKEKNKYCMTEWAKDLKKLA